MQLSVVINTYNRCASLAQTLESLRHQTHPGFEVIVVDGPSTDGTPAMLEQWSDRVRSLKVEDRNLGVSRNAGIGAAAGEVVAFIDDDSVAEPDWLESLAAAYSRDSVAGAGGIVLHGTGYAVQFRYSACDRTGRTLFDIEPPLDRYLGPGADPFLYLQGTNCSFRRTCLAEIGGFDARYEYMYDEVDVCLRLVDRGYELMALPGAAVHHHRLPSEYRKASGITLNPYPSVKNRALFALRHGTAGSREKALTELGSFVKQLENSADAWLAEGLMTPAEHERFRAEAQRGLVNGIEGGGPAEAKTEPIGPPQGEFLPFPTVRPVGPRMRICFLTSEYPPGYFGGIGRYTQDLSAAIAERGHEVHVIAPATTGSSIAFENGVWVHRVSIQDRDIPGLHGSPIRRVWLEMASLYHEAARLHETKPLDIVSAPLWNCTCLLPSLDGRFPASTTLTTTLATISELHPSWAGGAGVEAKLRLERLSARSAGYLHSISEAIAADSEVELGPLSGVGKVIPLGVPDHRPGAPEHGAAGEVTLLFTGRLERRKGVDLLLEVLPDLLTAHPNLRARLAGADTPNTEIGETYRQQFARTHAGNPGILSRVEFLGQVDEASLQHEYERCDLFCAPSRFESLGLVVLEAMGNGKPIVTCAAGGLKELVDENNGVLVEPGNAEALKVALDRLIADPELRRSMGDRSRAIFEAHWTIESAAARAVEGFRSFAAHFAEHPGSPAAMVDALAAVIEEVEQVSRTDADAVARALVEDRWLPLDHRGELRRLWTEPDDVFVDGLYQLFMHRRPDSAGRKGHLSRLRLGTTRAALVRVFAESPEARGKGIEHPWLPEIDAWPEPSSLHGKLGRLFGGPVAKEVGRRVRKALGPNRR